MHDPQFKKHRISLMHFGTGGLSLNLILYQYRKNHMAIDGHAPLHMIRLGLHIYIKTQVDICACVI